MTFARQISHHFPETMTLSSSDFYQILHSNWNFFGAPKRRRNCAILLRSVCSAVNCVYDVLTSNLTSTSRTRPGMLIPIRRLFSSEKQFFFPSRSCKHKRFKAARISCESAPFFKNRTFREIVQNQTDEYINNENGTDLITRTFPDAKPHKSHTS